MKKARPPKKLHPFTGYAIAEGNKLTTIAKAPLVYGTKRDAWLDHDEDWQRIVKVRIKEVK